MTPTHQKNVLAPLLRKKRKCNNWKGKLGYKSDLSKKIMTSTIRIHTTLLSSRRSSGLFLNVRVSCSMKRTVLLRHMKFCIATLYLGRRIYAVKFVISEKSINLIRCQEGSPEIN